MADLISRVSKLNTTTKLWVVGIGLVLALAWSVDSGTAPTTPTSAPANASTPSVSPSASPTPTPASPPPSSAVPSKQPDLSASNGTAPAIEPAAKNASVAELPPLTGIYSGVVHNLTAGLSSDFKIALTENNGAIRGCMEVQPPLVGSGPLQGTMNGPNVSFVVTSDAMQIAFDGRRDAGKLNGTYLVSARDGGSKQSGTFALQKMFAQTPPEAACAPI